ncbi:MAG TPA: DNA repair ATPase [Saprospiraceae bacterium]|nr:DNA repair ATPase [Saprospiraceae bacterium]
MNQNIDGGAYEIIRNRLQGFAGDLRTQLSQLNAARKEVFGAIDTRLIANDRIHTQNYCIARDIVSVGPYTILGYNVHMGLRKGIRLEDVFSVYDFGDNSFKEEGLALLAKGEFEIDFLNLYRYYKDAYFARFAQRGRYLYMVFHLKENSEDFKTFKWLMTEQGLEYIDNRSDHEVQYPDQYEFRWKQAGRDDQRKGSFPHVSIMDRVFVETMGGDLTIKVEDNTDDGLGIYREEVEYRDQTLDDAEYAYADLGNLIALRIRPYQETYRYFIFNEKIQEAKRIDALEQSGVLLPDNHGLIFANGYYLQTGEYKLFETPAEGRLFKKRIAAPNGEDFLYVFYHNQTGVYTLMHYNLISQEVNTPIICHGYTLLPEGQLCYFKAEDEPTRHHVIQIWQTPFVAGEAPPSEHKDSYLYKVGNKNIVKAMAECQEILTLIGKDDSYANLYDDLVKRSTDLLDAYYWLDQDAAFQLDQPLKDIRETANAAIEEYEKKVRVERSTRDRIEQCQTRAKDLFAKMKRESFDTIDLYVQVLADLRVLRGEIIGLKDLRYANLELIEALEEQAAEASQQLADDCVQFLLQEDALAPYDKKIEAASTSVEKITAARVAREQIAQLDAIGAELELLIDIVSNLKIDDATQTTRIIDNISLLFTRLNQQKAALKNRRKALQSTESLAAFNAQLKLLDQSIINYLDVADTPQKCDEYLSKLMVQLEEMESKFAEVDDFIGTLAEKREEVYTAFESRKNSLVEARNNRTAALQSAAQRILSGIQKRVENFREATEINSFFAADLMIEKIRDIVQRLEALEDSNKADAVQTELKTLKETALRQLRDKQDLFVEGENIIKLGKHLFSVNVQPLELTTVLREGHLFYHLTGTNFYESIQAPEIEESRAIWDQAYVSENQEVYRGEYLAYQLFRNQSPSKTQNLIDLVRQYAATRYQEGYTKGIHDEDAALILEQLVLLSKDIGLLYYTPISRALGKVFWTQFLNPERKALLDHQLKSAGLILQVFPRTHEFDFLITELEKELRYFIEATHLFPGFLVEQAARYLFRELRADDQFVCSGEAATLYQTFRDFIKKKKAIGRFRKTVEELKDNRLEQYQLLRKWVQAFFDQTDAQNKEPYLDEVATLLMCDDFEQAEVIETKTHLNISGLRGDHVLIKEGIYSLDFHRFTDKMERYCNEVVPLYKQFHQTKRQLTEQFRQEKQLEAFRPRVLSSFVRNKLIDQVYLPIFGDNFAKQLGTAGGQTRTDRMGLLLLISPPGYGKTTLMEYIAHSLGLIFVKINGPAIGHQVTSLAPVDANSMAARQELEKLNLALEMGDNIMLYLDDIQHCHPEFLQKFISLCDAQRKIEGVYKGQAKTYDLRGRRVAVVMAGNPYTEQGTRFQIPDMLANRADIYNLGDIIGDAAGVFKLSYIENALTSNVTLQQLAAKSQKDVYAIIQAAEQDNLEGIELEGNHSSGELDEYISVMKKLLRVRDVILAVNQEYIRSAAMTDDYRTEPPFKLQGSYRNMNKLAEKIVPIMNEAELETLILAHYNGESQTLTADAEANQLKLKEILGQLSDEEIQRWAEIKKAYNKNKLFRAGDPNDPMSRVIAQLSSFSEGLEGIKDVIKKAGK